jgi:predicted lipoprotein with Yx(FWY)xxD motif
MFVLIAVCGVLGGVGVAQGDATGTVVGSRVSHTYGQVLVGATRYTLYVFCSSGRVRCNGRRSRNYSPLIAHGRVLAAAGSRVNPNELGTRRLSGRRRQVTYYGQPLYYYKGDGRPGQYRGVERVGSPGSGWCPLGTWGSPAQAGQGTY